MNEKKLEVETEDIETVSSKESVLDKIQKIPGAPSKAQIDSWKTQYGNVFATQMPISGSLYIYRPISRLEWKQLQSIAPANADSGWIDEQLVNRCVLFPSMDSEKVATSLAGTVETITQQILSASDFYAENVAISLIHKL